MFDCGFDVNVNDSKSIKIINTMSVAAAQS